MGTRCSIATAALTPAGKQQMLFPLHAEYFAAISTAELRPPVPPQGMGRVAVLLLNRQQEYITDRKSITQDDECLSLLCCW